MVQGNAAKVSAFVLLLCVGAIGVAISKELGLGGATQATNSSALTSPTRRDATAGDSVDNLSFSEQDDELSHDAISAARSEEGTRADRPGQEEDVPFDEDILSHEPRTITAVTESDVSFSVLAVALEAAGLSDMLSGEGPFTIFAPTNDAFYALPPGQLEALLSPENRQHLVDLLNQHVVPGRVLSSDFKIGDMKTVEDGTVQVSLEESVTVNGAHIVEIDIPASNGVIHAVDAVILPELVSYAENSGVAKS